MMAFGASQLDVEVRYADDLTLRVSDNGTGLTPLSRIVGRTDTSDCKACGSEPLASKASSRSAVPLTPGLRSD